MSQIGDWPTQLRRELQRLEYSLSADQLKAAYKTAKKYTAYNLKHVELTYQLNSEIPQIPLNWIYNEVSQMHDYLVPEDPTGTAQIEKLHYFLKEMPTELPLYKAKWCRILLILRQFRHEGVDAQWPPEQVLYEKMLVKKWCDYYLGVPGGCADHPEQSPRVAAGLTKKSATLTPLSTPSRSVPVDIEKYIHSDTGIMDSDLIFEKLFLRKKPGIDDASFTVVGNTVSHSPNEGILWTWTVQWEGYQIPEIRKDSELRQLLQSSFEVRDCYLICA